MKNTRKMVIVAVEIIALLIFVASFISLGNEKINPQQIFAFSGNIEAGTKITESHLIKIPISTMTKTIDMIDASDYASIVGKYTTAKVYANTIAYRQQLSDLPNTTSLKSVDLSNSRIISIPIDFVEGVSGDLKQGDKIDLLYKGQGQIISSEDSGTFIYSKIFLQNITVYQVNTSDGYKFTPRANITSDDLISQGSDQDAIDNGSTAGIEDVASISLIVTPEQAEQIEARRMAGEIKLLKRFDESQTHETLGFVIGNYGKVFSGNANAETGSLQIVDSLADDDPNKSVNSSVGNPALGDGSNNSGSEGDSNFGVASGTTGID